MPIRSTAICTFVSSLALCVSLLATSAYAQSSEKIINVGTVINYPPLEFKDPKTGELTGFNHDLFEAMAKKAGFKVNWIEAAWVEQASFAPLRTGRVDVATGDMFDTPERRESGVSFIDFLSEPMYFYTLTAKADQFKDLAALCGKRVANSRGSKAMLGTVERWSQENCTKAGKPAVEQLEVASTAEQMLALKQGRVDAGFTNASNFAASKMSDGDLLKQLGEPLGKFLLGFPVLATNTALRDTLKKSLDQVIADGTYAQLLNKWYLREDSSIGNSSTIDAGK
ncbi:transporter substrate-binding domain-containing protein [Bradyrhizobium sp. B097]|uniref:transporter substrate-binding domain-containing protein n=1 Tax=Bradyrhizobium sp. B097 TaxID=3140244 RepID=UPI003182BB4E